MNKKEFIKKYPLNSIHYKGCSADSLKKTLSNMGKIDKQYLIDLDSVIESELEKFAEYLGIHKDEIKSTVKGYLNQTK